MNRKIGIASLGVAGALALGAGVPALAQSGDSSTTPTPSPTATDDLREQFQERRDAAQRDFAERLAEELGVDADKVAAALEKVRSEMQDESQADRLAGLQERLDQAVEDGDLTRAQADAILEAAKSGVFPGGPGEGLRGRLGGHHGFRGGPGMFGDGGRDTSSGSATQGTSAALGV